MENITVVIPVGPDPAYLDYLPECIESVLNQTHQPSEIVFINDQQPNLFFSRYFPNGWEQRYNNGEFLFRGINGKTTTPLFREYQTPWLVGVADAFNFGVALAKNNLVFLLGSDDTLMPTCLEECVKAYKREKIEGWYNVTIETSSGEKSWIPNNAAMVTQELWKFTGGFGPSAFAGPDAWLLSILMKHAPERIIQVKQNKPLYWVREHPSQDTKKTAWVFGSEMVSIRNKETERWKPHTF